MVLKEIGFILTEPGVGIPGGKGIYKGRNEEIFQISVMNLEVHGKMNKGTRKLEPTYLSLPSLQSASMTYK